MAARTWSARRTGAAGGSLPGAQRRHLWHGGGRRSGPIYTRIRKPRGREMDIAIAACALVHGAVLWTLNPEDFRDIPDLRLV